MNALEHLSNKGVFNKFDELITFKKELRTEVDFMYHFIPIIYLVFIELEPNINQPNMSISFRNIK